MDLESIKAVPPLLIPAINDFALKELKKLLDELMLDERGYVDHDFTIDTRPAPLPMDKHWLPIADEDGYEYRLVIGIRAFPKRDK